MEKLTEKETAAKIDIDTAKNALEKDDPRYAKYFDKMSDADIIKAYRHITKQ